MAARSALSPRPPPRVLSGHHRQVDVGEVIGAAGRERPTEKRAFDGPLTLQPFDKPFYHRLQVAHAAPEALTPTLMRANP
jgi:hypothetical protein